jgi:hypothetical protein
MEKLEDLFEIREYPNHPVLYIMEKRRGVYTGVAIPFDLMPELVSVLQAHLTQRATDGAWACVKCGRDNKKGQSRCWCCGVDAPSR